MRDYKNIVAILLISFISIGLISYFALSHIDSTRKLSQNANKAFNYYEPLVFLDFTEKNQFFTKAEKFQGLLQISKISQQKNYVPSQTQIFSKK